MARAGVAPPAAVKSKEFFPGLFSRHAEAYHERLDGIMARGEAKGRMRVIELAAAGPGMQIVDLACGPGTLSRLLAEKVAPDGEVIGVDLAPGMIELASAAGIANAEFEVMDIETLMFGDAFFDGAVCGHGLQFVPDLGRALREARRVLKPGGGFAASVPVSTKQEAAWDLLDSVLDRWLVPRTEVVDQARTREVVSNSDSLRRATLDAGFSSANVEVIEEQVQWESAEQLVTKFMSWWDCAARLETVPSDRRDAIKRDAIATLKREQPGLISTTGRNHVLDARK
ncbi:MAG: methyltransferase domain-containing protein [Chloroflexi bacterium]|nr:MAG: methyltransferase domain-containing protein [Chloroflexota bacterium]